MVDGVNGETEKGFDNLGATDDDGASRKPDLVISVQPNNERTRAELPVSTVDWRSNPRGQFIPVHGLDFLIGVSSLLIQQTVELDDITSKIESENRYIVRIPNGEALYIASETSSPTQRCLCGSGRAFSMHLHDNTRQEAMVLKRRLAGSSCCFPCRLQEMKVITPPGDYVGRVQQQCTWVVPVYRVRDASDQLIFVIEGPAVMRRSALMLSEFKILTGDCLREVGRIAHGWDRDLVSFVTTLQIPDLAVQPKHKCLLLAATFLLDKRPKVIEMMLTPSCPIPTNADKIWTHDQYYFGERDSEHRRNGDGENHWTGAESLEWYTGRFLRDTMHGEGEYRSRYRGDKGVFVTYEGHFYANRMHGYGTMSYPDGAVFTGIFHKDFRWGPGVESQACLREDVGFWRGSQLVRLAWKPTTPNLALDLNVGVNGKACVEPHRVILTTVLKTIGEVNSAIELLKQSGAEPIAASEKWSKLYPKNCTDLASQMCHVDLFERDYYKNRVLILEEVDSMPVPTENTSQLSAQSFESGTFFAWNNSKMTTHMMKHCYTHEYQRTQHSVDLQSILSGPRSRFKRPGRHEIECRTLLMASYLGHIADVARLVNELNVHPDVADIQGNTALMYATCGNQVDTIHFLVEAGADVNSYCDNCCTPLGVALMKFACVSKDITPNGMVQALIPPPIVPAPPVSLEPKPSEWHIIRDLTASPSGNIPRSPSKTGGKAAVPPKKIKPSPSEEMTSKRKTELIGSKTDDDDGDDEDSEEIMLFNSTNTEFIIRVTDLFSLPSAMTPIPYLFEINDMVIAVDAAAAEEDQKKSPEKNPKKVVSKVIKDTIKPSKEIMWQNSDRDEFGSINSAEKARIEAITSMMMTILQLLSDGADPKLVRCPQPALLLAVASGCPELVRHLVNYGADVNEFNPQFLNYTALDIAVSRLLTYETIDLVRALLECGAKSDHRLKYGDPGSDPAVPEIPGPTLLHAVLARKTENETEEELRRQLMEMLLEYNCDPMVQFRGRSAVDVAMGKGMEIFDIFLKCPQTDLNTAINEANQTVLVKIFSTPFCKTLPTTERLQTITNLLLYGADPLLECRSGEEIYKNIFVYAKKVFAEMESSQSKPVSPSAGKDAKGKKPEKPKKDEKLVAKSIGKLAIDDVGDYKQALDVMTECARILHIRWLQAKLFKELLEVVVKYKHRQWNMIMPEHKNKKPCGLWLTCGRALEVWDILKTTKRKLFKETRVLKHILCIVQFYARRSKTGFRHRLAAEEKDMIESKVKYILYDHKMAEPLHTEEIPWSRPYVTPELDVKEEKYIVCFECGLPFEEEKIQCAGCKLVSFCSFECMKINVDRAGCHPCSEFLRNKYFPSPDESIIQDVIDVV